MITELKKHKIRLIIYAAGLAIFLIAIFAVRQNKNEPVKIQGRANETNTIAIDTLSPISSVVSSGTAQISDLYLEPKERDFPIYVTEGNDIAGIYEFMQANPVVENSNNVKGVSSSGSTMPRRLLPADFHKNSRLVRKVNENLTRLKLRRPTTRYYFNQEVAGRSVLGAVARFDIEGGNQIVGFEGNLLNNPRLIDGELSQEDAVRVATEKAKKDNHQISSFALCSDKSVEQVVVNPNLLGISPKDESCLTIAVPLCNSDGFVRFDTTYYVCKKDGVVVFENPSVHEALNRVIYNCGGGNCARARTEGQSATGDNDVDSSYQIVGDVYNYFFNTYQRDSFDGRGSTLQARVKYTGFSCPNAAWNGREMAACPGMVANDVWGHELAHGVTQYTASLLYSN